MGPTTESNSLVIGICTFNRGQAFEPTLGALTKLDRVDGRLARIVVVDNASTDDTAEVVRAFARANPAVPIELIHEPKQGKLHAMCALFARTTEPFIAIIDDDTVPAPGWARELLALMDDKPRCGIAGGPVRNRWESGPTKLAIIYRRSLGDFDLGHARLRLDKPESFLLGASLLCRRQAVEVSGWLAGSKLAARTGTDLQSGAEDAELCIRIRQAGWEVWYDPAASMEHLIPARRQTTAYLARLRGDVERSMPAIYWVAGLVPDAARAERELRRARAKLWKTRLFDWRWWRRSVRLAERQGRIDGWRRVLARLRGA